MKLLSMCSSRSHPGKLREMLGSYISTRTEGFGKMVVYIWEKDPKIEGYKKVMKEFEKFEKDIIFIISSHRYMTEVLNYLCEKYPDYDYYQNINDDHYYAVKGWDKMMIEPLEKNNGWGISYCKGSRNMHNPNAEIISGKIVKILGYYIYPKYRQFGIEPFITSLGKETGFFLVPEVIEHRCINAGYGEKDDVYNFIYSSKETLNASQAFKEWDEKKQEAFKKIRDAIAEEYKNEANYK